MTYCLKEIESIVVYSQRTAALDWFHDSGNPNEIQKQQCIGRHSIIYSGGASSVEHLVQSADPIEPLVQGGYNFITLKIYMRGTLELDLTRQENHFNFSRIDTLALSFTFCQSICNAKDLLKEQMFYNGATLQFRRTNTKAQLKILTSHSHLLEKTWLPDLS
ncbi:hypothetical protein CEXT_200591 [Caerostris extrusa]|uniref:Uncharacterized protein n=1 Tax=Caerostris extrusa TaxID=172846 RepID=A0AAV4MXR4_CAEEX|nr:hypothetical protein CEXT_200591 [Caerostris extrusa]